MSDRLIGTRRPSTLVTWGTLVVLGGTQLHGRVTTMCICVLMRVECRAEDLTNCGEIVIVKKSTIVRVHVAMVLSIDIRSVNSAVL